MNILKDFKYFSLIMLMMATIVMFYIPCLILSLFVGQRIWVWFARFFKLFD